MGSWRSPGVAALAVATAASACNVVTSIVVTGADFGGATADVHCDRRYVSDGGQRSAFCQEVVATLAASQFSDDCRDKHQATPGPGLCPRERVIAGCKLDKKTADDSKVWDWYYDVSDIVMDAGPEAGLEGGPTFADPVPLTTGDVGIVCADRSRYEEGAELVSP